MKNVSSRPPRLIRFQTLAWKKIQNTDDINTFNENQTLHDTPYTLFHGSLLYSVLIHSTIRTAGL